MYSYLKRKIDSAYIFIYGHTPGNRFTSFINNITWSFIGIGISSILLFISYILLGRQLGPEQFGKYSLFISISGILSMVLLLSRDSVVIKYVPGNHDKNFRKAEISNSVYLITGFTLLVWVIFLSISGYIKSHFGNIFQIIFYSLVYSSVLAFKYLFESVIKAFGNFKVQSLSKLIEGVGIFILVAGIVFCSLHQYQYYIYGSIIIYFSMSIIFLKFIYPYLGRWNMPLFKKSLRYSINCYLAIIIGVLISNMDRIFMAKYLGFRLLGIYSVYLIASTTVISQVLVAVNNVLLPNLTEYRDYISTKKKIDKIILLSLSPLFIGVFLITFFIMFLVGKSYAINYWYIFLVSIISCIQLVASLYGQIALSSARIYQKVVKMYLYKPLLTLVLYINYMVFFRNTGLYYFFMMVFISNLFDYLIQYFVIKKYELVNNT